MKIFKLPDLGEGLPDAEIHQWHVKVGDVVKMHDLLASMETAKAVVDVPSPYAGKITKLHGNPGDIIKTGEPLVEFEALNIAAKDSEFSEPSPADAGTVVGSFEVTDKVIEEAAAGITPTRSTEPGIKAIPAVRALAKKLNVDITQVNPTGPNGQITAEDVEKAAKHSPASGAATATSATGPTECSVEPVRGVRRAMATAMAQSHAEVVPVTLIDDADIHAWAAKTDITARVIRALVAGCQAEPELNAYFDSKKLEKRIFHTINIGIAMDSRDGLFVPVIKHAEKLNPTEIRSILEQFKDKAKNRTFSQEDLKDSTIQLSNFGSLAGKYANPIVVPPIVAILGTGKIHSQLVIHEGQMTAHRMIPLSLTFDHRTVTGGEGARFLAAVITDLEKAE